MNGSTDTDAYKEGLKTIHTNVVSNHRASHPTNRVLQRSAPDISASETVLPRRYRTTLAQLRSGQCSRLLTYKHAIGLSPTDVCPEWNSEPHTTSPLFRCSAASTLPQPSHWAICGRTQSKWHNTLTLSPPSIPTPPCSCGHPDHPLSPHSGRSAHRIPLLGNNNNSNSHQHFLRYS